MITMDKMNYIAELESVLKERMKPATLNKIIEYYAQYFDDHIEQGTKEEDISAELGTPAELAESLMDGMSLKEFELFNSEETVRMIDASLFDIRIHLVFTDQPTTSITYQSRDEYDERLLRVAYRSNHLRIVQEKPRFTKGKPYLLLELPKAYKGKLVVKTIDSRIVVDGNYMESKATYTLSSRHGKIELNDVICKKIDVQSQDGRIKLQRCTANQMTLENKSGNIDITKCKTPYLSAKNLQGRIDVSRTYSEYTEFESLEGRVYVEDCIIDDCHMQSEHGKIFYGMDEINEGLHLDLLSRQGKVVINGEKLQKNIQIVKDIKSRKKEKRYLNVYARSSTGRIEILH